jgi:hypothetical protein
MRLKSFLSLSGGLRLVHLQKISCHESKLP